MESKYLPLLMMALFLIVVIGGRIGAQLVSVGDSGIRSATRLRTIRAVFISLLMFGTLIVQLLLSLLYAAAVLEPHIALGKAGTWTGLALCLGGILFASYSQFAMGKNWRIGVDPDEETELVTSGIYSKIRNPIYTACIVHGLGLLVLAPNTMMLLTGLVGFYAITAYVQQIEEPYLINLHGEEYVQYMESTGSFLPRLF
jgi:protein-S-isoprenylcysteine O-methyltransferase Ste14